MNWQVSIFALIVTLAAIVFGYRFQRGDTPVLRVVIDRRTVGRFEQLAYSMALLGAFTTFMIATTAMLHPLLAAQYAERFGSVVEMNVLTAIIPSLFMTEAVHRCLRKAATWFFERERALREAKELEVLRSARAKGADLSDLREEYWRRLDEFGLSFRDGAKRSLRRASDGNPVNLLPERYEDLLSMTESEWRQRRGDAT